MSQWFYRLPEFTKFTEFINSFDTFGKKFQNLVLIIFGIICLILKNKTTNVFTDHKFYSLFLTVNDQSFYVGARQLSVGQVRFVINPFTRN